MDGKLRTTVEEFIGNTCELLDQEQFSQFLSECTEEFSYRVSTHSPDLGKDMVWLDHDRNGFESMIRMLPEHVRIDASLSRHAIVASMTRIDASSAAVRTKLSVFQTDLNGTSSVLAIGTYRDVVDISEPEKPKLKQRELRLDTRELGPGVHVPL